MIPRRRCAAEIEFVPFSLRRDPFSRALGEIRLRLRSGALVQGEQLQVAGLAKTLRLSATPVREALSRLAGEGAIDDRRGAGYFAPRLDAVDLADLYGLSWTYVAAALRGGRNWPPASSDPAPNATAPPGALEPDLVGRTEALFDLLARRSGSPALRRAQAQLAGRLAAVRRIEPLVLANVEEELVSLEAAATVQAGDLHDRLAAYHERRRQAAAGLIAALRSAAAPKEL